MIIHIFKEKIKNNMRIKGPFVTNFFNLDDNIKRYLKKLTPNFGFGLYGETVFYRTYSRIKRTIDPEGNEIEKQESWADVVIRVTEGIMSIRKDYYIKNGLGWNDNKWQEFAKKFSKYMFKMRFLPPGRGLWACGTDFMYNRGSAALNNCGAATTKDFVLGAVWTMDMLMNGCGVGFDTLWNGEYKIPNKDKTYTYIIPDTREGWCESFGLLLSSYVAETQWKPDFEVPEGKEYPIFDYSLVRAKGEPIRGFGGVASGPEPLKKLHKRLRIFMETYIKYREYLKKTVELRKIKSVIKDIKYLKQLESIYSNEKYEVFKFLIEELDKDGCLTEWDDKEALLKSVKENLKEKSYGIIRCIVDVINSIGACVVAGNVRRSAEIALGEVGDEEFCKLKNYKINPERSSIGWMSNNSVRFKKSEEFSKYIPEISKRIKDNGEPGFVNQLNIERFGRVGRREYPKDQTTREHEKDNANIPNPCITGDSSVLTSEGLKKVTDLIGKKFTAVINGSGYDSTEKGFWSNGVKNVYKITLENGMSIKATNNHKFYKKSMNKEYLWDEVMNLIIGESLCCSDNEYSKIVSIKYIGTEEVYDCTVTKSHCFLANGILTHNCSEIPLESFELCCLAEVFPTKCNDFRGNFDENVYNQACRFATFYTSTVSLLPTHWIVTNKVIARNHRTGVSQSGVADFYDIHGCSKLVHICKEGYKIIRQENKRLAREAGVCESIRVTTNKPSGTLSSITGVSPGIHFPTFKYAIRRMRVAANHKIAELLIQSGVPHEKDTYSDNTMVFEFPIDQGKTREATEVSMWEQFAMLAMLQREWSDNMVSVTIYFNPKTEADQIEYALAQFAPLIKSCSMLPHTEKGVYAQAPYEGITKEKYEELKESLVHVDWKKYSGNDGIMPRYCTNDTCTL